MLAFRVPVPVQYDWPTVVWSLVAAIAAFAVELVVVSRPRMSTTQALLGSVLMGGGIAAMHYIGMATMRMPAMYSYSAGMVEDRAGGVGYETSIFASQLLTSTQIAAKEKSGLIPILRLGGELGMRQMLESRLAPTNTEATLVPPVEEPGAADLWHNREALALPVRGQKRIGHR